MKRFRFRLDRLLHLRQKQEELVKLRLGQASRLVEEIQQGIDQVRSQQVETRIFDSLATLHYHQAWMSRLGKNRRELEERRELARAQREEILVEFRHARQKAEVLRRLEDKARADYRLENIRVMDAESDDMVQSRLLMARLQAETREEE